MYKYNVHCTMYIVHNAVIIIMNTDYSIFLQVARQMLQGPASYKKVALLITDGKSNTGGSPVNFASEMR